MPRVKSNPESCQICNPTFRNPVCSEREAVYACENLELGHVDHHCRRTYYHPEHEESAPSTR